MPERMATFEAYEAAVAVLVAYEQQHDPERARLLRGVFAAQQVFLHELMESIAMSGQSVSRLADRVQNHIGPQLMTLMQLSERSSVRQDETHATVIEIARLLRERPIRPSPKPRGSV